jgi:hypothetical protein
MVVYVLALKDGFYYIGRFNIFQIKNGGGSSWTKLHPPVSVVETIYRDAEYDEEFDEDEIVYKYMKKYGIDKVRGGSYSTAVLTDYSIKILNEKLNKNEYIYKANENSVITTTTTDADFTTVVYDSSKKNQSSDSKKSSRVSSSSSAHVCSYCEVSFIDDVMLKKHEERCMDSYFTKNKNDGKICERCGRHTHITQYCKAKTDIQGYII